MRDMKQVFMYGIKKYTEIGVVLERNQMFWDDAPWGCMTGSKHIFFCRPNTYSAAPGVVLVHSHRGAQSIGGLKYTMR